MKTQQIFRELLLERVKRALRVDQKKMMIELQRLGLKPNTLYDFLNYQRAYVQKKTAIRLYLATKATIG